MPHCAGALKSLSDLLDVPEAGSVPEAELHLEDIAGNAEAFCQAVLNSREFRKYIVHGLTMGSIPAAVMIRVMDQAGWQKPPERVEHTGKDGNPIVQEVRRVIVHARINEEDAAEELSSTTLTTH